MRVALVQFSAGLDPAENRVLIDQLLSTLDHGAVDLVVLPEATMAGFGRTDHDLGAIAEPVGGQFTQFLGNWASRLDCSIVAGMFERGEPRPYNTLVVVAPSGDVAHAYRKIHLFDTFGRRESDRFAAGPLTPVTFEIAGRRIGIMSCYDLRFPELARALVDDGADLLLVPAAWIGGENKLHQWRTLLTARAIENVCEVIGSNQSGPRYVGHSMLIDPQGTIVVEASDEPGVTLLEVDAETVAAARRENPSLNNRRIKPQ